MSACACDHAAAVDSDVGVSYHNLEPCPQCKRRFDESYDNAHNRDRHVEACSKRKSLGTQKRPSSALQTSNKKRTFQPVLGAFFSVAPFSAKSTANTCRTGAEMTNCDEENAGVANAERARTAPGCDLQISPGTKSQPISTNPSKADAHNDKTSTCNDQCSERTLTTETSDTFATTITAQSLMELIDTAIIAKRIEFCKGFVPKVPQPFHSHLPVALPLNKWNFSLHPDGVRSDTCQKIMDYGSDMCRQCRQLLHSKSWKDIESRANEMPPTLPDHLRTWDQIKKRKDQLSEEAKRLSAQLALAEKRCSQSKQAKKVKPQIKKVHASLQRRGPREETDSKGRTIIRLGPNDSLLDLVWL